MTLIDIDADVGYGQIKLKPCPFCGGDPVTYERGWDWAIVVTCLDCGYSISGFDTTEKAIDMWNTGVENERTD